MSRTEWDKGFFKSEELEKSICIAPKGSIALKLGYLASGSCEFVVSKQPKNIWDIAAGTILCKERGIELLSEKTVRKN